MLAVDRGDHGALLACQGHHELTRRDQHLLARESNSLTPFDRSQGWEQPDHSGDTDDDHIDIRGSGYVDERVHAVLFVDGDLRDSELASLLFESRPIATGGESDDLKPIALFPHHVQSLPTDAAGRAENGKSKHGQVYGFSARYVGDVIPGNEPMWRRFFDLHAPNYDQNPFTKNTRVECDFLIEVMALTDGARVLDMGCGTGRHAIELAGRGYRVTGVDFSEGMLAEARRKADEASVEVDWIQSDARTFEGVDFDAAICLCEGAVGLIEHQEEPVAHDLAIFRAIAAALRPDAPFVLTALNAYATIRRMTDEAIEAGQFDPATMISFYQDEWDLPEGKTLLTIRERLFIPPEVVAMLHHAGLRVENIWGGTAGDWGKRAIKLDEIEVMYVCRKA